MKYKNSKEYKDKEAEAYKRQFENQRKTNQNTSWKDWRWRRKHQNFFQNRYDEIKDDIEHPEDIVKNLGEDITEVEDDFVMSTEELSRFYRRLRRMGILFWVFNLAFVATPFILVTLVSFMTNIFLNVVLNQWWAYGNIFLIANTLYMMFQSLMAIPLIYEIPFIL